MNSTQDATNLLRVRAELKAGLVCISDQIDRLDDVIEQGGAGGAERRDLWRMEVNQASLAEALSIILDRVARAGQPLVVLVVEDDMLVLMSAIADLEAAGFTVIAAASADEALDQLRTGRAINAIFTDVQMPGTMDGLSLARAVHARWPLVKVIVTSGNTQFGPNDIAVGDDFFRKPYHASDIVKALRRH